MSKVYNIFKYQWWWCFWIIRL